MREVLQQRPHRNHHLHPSSFTCILGLFLLPLQKLNASWKPLLHSFGQDEVSILPVCASQEHNGVKVVLKDREKLRLRGERLSEFGPKRQQQGEKETADHRHNYTEARKGIQRGEKEGHHIMVQLHIQPHYSYIQPHYSYIHTYTLLHELACNIVSYCTSGRGIFTSLVPSPSSGPFEISEPVRKSEKRAWYPLFAHALNFPTFREFWIIPCYLRVT